MQTAQLFQAPKICITLAYQRQSPNYIVQDTPTSANGAENPRPISCGRFGSSFTSPRSPVPLPRTPLRPYSSPQCRTPCESASPDEPPGIACPDPWPARQVIQQARALAPNTPIVVRARYHIHRTLLEVAGADAVVDEEEEVGIQIAAEVRHRLITGNG